MVAKAWNKMIGATNIFFVERIVSNKVRGQKKQKKTKAENKNTIGCIS